MPNAAIWFEMFNILISKALNYPVDLYYLMDLSNSMSDDRENVVKVCTNWEEVEVRADQPENGLIWILIKLVQLGGELAKAIEAITPDYQIGWVNCSCCPFAHSMKWPDQPLQLVLWPPCPHRFGSFVDKEVMPYISLVQVNHHRQQRCHLKNKNCTRQYIIFPPSI